MMINSRRVSENILDTMGNTPIVKLNRLFSNDFANVYGKLEYFNPSGSIKDRMALYIINDAEKRGLLKRGGTIVENSSGNTGAAFAMIAALKGYKCIVTMPDKMSIEKINLVKAFGAKVIVTPTDVPYDSPDSYYSVARRIAKETEGSFYPDQYNNLKNAEAHYSMTGPEIWEQMNGEIDYLVAGIGTGGTLSGVARFLKEKKSDIKIIAVDPEGSVFYEYFKTGKLCKPNVYKVEGIGEDYLVKSVDFSLIDDIIKVNDNESFEMSRKLAIKEGIFAGGSSGSAMVAVNRLIDTLNEKKNIVAILPDSGYRYFSKFYNEDWMIENGFNI